MVNKILLLSVNLISLATVSLQQQSPPSRSALERFCEPESSDKYAACSLMLRGGCQDDESKPYCNTLSLHNALCQYDNPPGAASICQSYTAYCEANQDTCNVVGNRAWPNWVSSVELQYQIDRMCKDHNMEGCDWCRGEMPKSPLSPVSALNTCDSLNTYSALCKSMPEMTGCAAAWKPMCVALPNSHLFFPNICSAAAFRDEVDDGTGDALRSDNQRNGGQTNAKKRTYYTLPPMRMYFHQDTEDLLLFRSCLTKTPFQYCLAALVVMLITFGFSGWVYMARRVLIPKLNTQLTRIRSEYLRSSKALNAKTWELSKNDTSIRMPFNIRYEALLACRSILLVIELMWSYIVMLIVMAYNYGWIGAFLIGAFLGNMVFNRDAPMPKSSIVDVDMQQRCSDDGHDGLLKQATCC